MTQILIGNIRVSVSADEDTILKKAREKMKRAGFATTTLHFHLYKRSVDARKRDEICFVCSVLAESDAPAASFPADRLKKADARIFENQDLDILQGSELMRHRPMVVGMGPAGLFAALLLARNGYAPILIDRGGSVEERVGDVSRFREKGQLDTESNIQFGAGGAGTFSDGKLVTRIHDPKCGFVLQTLYDFGAPEEILVKAKPHVGTDRLRVVVSAMLEEIQRLGGEVIYRCRMDDFTEKADGSLCVKTSRGEFQCGALILAPGHSARDTYLRLIQKGAAIEPKPISVGVRVEHLQRNVDEALYGRYAGHPNLGPAEYALSDTTGPRGVYTFCMCPGGEVVAAASEEEGLVVNGMSYHARNGANANSAVAVSVHCEDVEPVNGNLALGMIAFQRKLERAAFVAGGSNYYAPMMTMGDFMNGTRGAQPTSVLPSYRDGKVRCADFDSVFPAFVTKGLKYGFCSFGKKLKGYDAPEAILTAAETRTSAPVRILRNQESLLALGMDRVYPCGEGAGYAGGITSAAVDGIRVALALMKRFAPLEK